MSEQTLVPVEQKQVLFYEDEITAVQTQDGHVFVPVRPLCDLLGVAWNGQRERINRDLVLRDVVRGVRVTRTPGTGGGTQEMLCLPLEYLNGWLFGIQASRVKPAIRDRLVRYQRECYHVLFAAFQRGELRTDPDVLDVEALAAAGDEAAQALLMAQAIVKIARQQLAYQQQTDARLEALEGVIFADDRHISEAQASRLSQAVKAVAMTLSKQTKRNEYGGVYGELYRRYDITGYKMLPANKFDDAMNWLSEWLAQLNDERGF